jgi:hypothetical protein
MALETGTYIDDLVSTNPTATDDVSQGDDHIRLLKSTIQASFPNITGAMTATQDDLNQIDNGQFAFPATQNPSADANTLDDYEEGTFNPTFTVNSGTVTINPSENTLSYTKIGRVVYIKGRVAVSSVSTPSGVLNLAGLPFAIPSETEQEMYVSSPVWSENLNGVSDGFALMVRESLATSDFNIEQVGGTDAGAVIQATSRLHFNFFYFTT